ncbi:hypothetical protein [Blastochloris sulfoviridis]|uniref:Cell envelope biogenesis protein TolA n=1 Tax=Blastochloris sulfoviridis TaxID=50712 RepID=A0A5M6I4K9_9HYPH|nr:hypothetical protein [Blastochloris sulfoviridis]KAA5603144.1 hypothetical protein F1193_02670 [Blastochloris sulfoviridis]
MRTGIALSATAHLILVTLTVVLAGPAPFNVEPAEGILVDLVTPEEAQEQPPEETAKVDEPEKPQLPEIEKTKEEFAKDEMKKEEKAKEEKAKEEKILPAAQDLLQDLRKEARAETPKEAPKEAAKEAAKETAQEPSKEPAREASKEPERQPEKQPEQAPARDAAKEPGQEASNEASKEPAKGPPPPAGPPPPLPPVRPPELARPDSAPPASPPEAAPQDAQPDEAPPAGPALAGIPLPAMAEAPTDNVTPPLAPDLLMEMARLGKANGFDAVAEEQAKLTPDEIAAFRTSVQKCWTRPTNIPANAKLQMVMRVSFKPDGALAADPMLIAAPASKLGPALVRAAQAAVKRCQPYAALPADKYKEWRVLDLRFSPAGIVGG